MELNLGAKLPDWLIWATVPLWIVLVILLTAFCLWLGIPHGVGNAVAQWD